MSLPRSLLRLLDGTPVPFLAYERGGLREEIRQVRRWFPHYSYPVKCNPHPELLSLVLELEVGFDVCSEPELQQVLGLGVDPGSIAYTGPALTPARVRRLGAAGCRTHLDSLQEAVTWAATWPGQGCGVRLQAATGGSYGPDARKLGVVPEELPALIRVLGEADCRLQGVHCHTGHRGRSPVEFAEWATATLLPLPGEVIPGLEWLDLGGGWPYAYEEETPWGVEEIWSAIEEGPLRGMRERGFRGRLEVQPGEFLVAGIGWLVAEVGAIKPGREERIIILDTPTPVPSTPFSYRMTALRRDGNRHRPISSSPSSPCAVFGVSNTPRDLIRRGVMLPDLEVGDLLVLGDTGAYVGTLMGRFCGRLPPQEHII